MFGAGWVKSCCRPVAGGLTARPVRLLEPAGGRGGDRGVAGRVDLHVVGAPRLDSGHGTLRRDPGPVADLGEPAWTRPGVVRVAAEDEAPPRARVRRRSRAPLSVAASTPLDVIGVFGGTAQKYGAASSDVRLGVGLFRRSVSVLPSRPDAGDVLRELGGERPGPRIERPLDRAFEGSRRDRLVRRRREAEPGPDAECVREPVRGHRWLPARNLGSEYRPLGERPVRIVVEQRAGGEMTLQVEVERRVGGIEIVRDQEARDPAGRLGRWRAPRAPSC